MSFSWDNEQYLLFERERSVPLKDVILKVKDLRANMQSVLDIGCGPGNSTRALAEHFPVAKILGIDNSENMISKARNSTTSDFIDFALLSAEHINNDSLMQIRRNSNVTNKIPTKGFDLIFANASLHWIREQESFLTRIFSLLNNKGIFATQIPLDSKSLFHNILQDVIASKWTNTFDNKRAFYSLQDIEYLEILSSLSKQVYVWESVYYHVLPDIEAVLAWYEGSGLRPYLEKLTNIEQENLRCDLMHALHNAYEKEGRLNNGNIIMKVPRLFFIAIRD